MSVTLPPFFQLLQFLNFGGPQNHLEEIDVRTSTELPGEAGATGPGTPL